MVVFLYQWFDVLELFQPPGKYNQIISELLTYYMVQYLHTFGKSGMLWTLIVDFSFTFLQFQLAVSHMPTLLWWLSFTLFILYTLLVLLLPFSTSFRSFLNLNEFFMLLVMFLTVLFFVWWTIGICFDEMDFLRYICETVSSTVMPVFCRIFSDWSYERFSRNVPLTASIWREKKCTLIFDFEGFGSKLRTRSDQILIRIKFLP